MGQEQDLTCLQLRRELPVARIAGRGLEPRPAPLDLRPGAQQWHIEHATQPFAMQLPLVRGALQLVVYMDCGQCRRIRALPAPALQQVQQDRGIEPTTETHIPVRSVEQRQQPCIQRGGRQGRFSHARARGDPPRRQLP